MDMPTCLSIAGQSPRWEATRRAACHRTPRQSERVVHLLQVAYHVRRQCDLSLAAGGLLEFGSTKAEFIDIPSASLSALAGSNRMAYPFPEASR